MLTVARAQRKVYNLEHQLMGARVEESEALGKLYQFKMQDTQRRVAEANVDIGLIRRDISKHNVPFQHGHKRCRTSSSLHESFTTSMYRYIHIYQIYLSDLLSHSCFRLARSLRLRVFCGLEVQCCFGFQCCRTFAHNCSMCKAELQRSVISLLYSLLNPMEAPTVVLIPGRGLGNRIAHIDGDPRSTDIISAPQMAT